MATPPTLVCSNIMVDRVPGLMGLLISFGLVADSFDVYATGWLCKISECML